MDLGACAKQVLKDLIVQEIEVKSTDGRFFLMRVRPYRTTTNVIDGVVIMFDDISKRKRAEAALERSEIFHRDAVEAAGAVPYYRNYEADVYDSVGEGIVDLVGCAVGDFTPRFLQAICEQVFPIDNLDGLSVKEALQQLNVGECTKWRSIFQITTPDGEKKWLDDAARPVYDDNRKLIGAVGILRDVTAERGEAKEEI